MIVKLMIAPWGVDLTSTLTSLVVSPPSTACPYDPSAGQEGARAGGHSWRKVLGRYGRGQLREDEGDGQVGLVRALVHLL